MKIRHEIAVGAGSHMAEADEACGQFGVRSRQDGAVCERQDREGGARSLHAVGRESGTLAHRQFAARSALDRVEDSLPEGGVGDVVVRHEGRHQWEDQHREHDCAGLGEDEGNQKTGRE